MNKFLGLMFLCVTFSVMAQPVLEISEFGKDVPVVNVKLSGSEQNFSGQNWNCSVRKVYGNVNSWELEFKSPSHEPVRLAVKFISPLKFKPLRFWDGAREYNAEDKVINRSNFLEAFPLTVAEDGNKGTALGFAPENILSGFSRSMSKKALSLETRIVVDDRKVQKLTVVEYDFTPEFGWRNAVEDYHNAFLNWFKPIPGIDKRIFGVGGYLSGAHKQRAFQLHSARKTGIQWEWTYAPWYESGNWYPVGDGWKSEKYEWRSYFKIRQNAMLTREEYDEALKTQMSYGDKVAAMFYYILVKDIHQNVANSYPQAVQGNSGLSSLPSNRGKTKSAFAPGTPLFDYLKKQLKQVVENYEVSGFSFDMANSSYHFTTPSQLEYAVGRSWYDDGKIFTSDTVTPIPFADYIHSLKRNGKTMGTVFNAALSKFSPFTMFHCDAVIMEGPPHYNYSMVLPLRLIMGRKPFTFWHFNPAVSDGIKTAFLANDPEGKARLARGLKDFYLLKCYELGANPMNWESNNVFWHPHLPILRKLSEAGFHPVSAVKDAAPFWTGRFGDGVGTIITLSNPKREKITRTIKIINRYLGKGKYAFLPTQGVVKQTWSDGATVFQLTLEPKEIVVLRTIEIQGNISELTAVATDQHITFDADSAFSFILPSVDLTGKRIIGDKDGIFEGNTAKNIKLAMLPECGVFAKKSAMADFLAQGHFPIVESGKDRESKIAAEMVSMYRSHVNASMISSGMINNREPGFMDAALCKPDLSITTPGKGGVGRKICIGIKADYPNFKVSENFVGPFLSMPDANTLWIGGSTPDEVRKAADTYFSILDKFLTSIVKVDFKRPSSWGGNEKFVAGDGQKYLQIVGNPALKNNKYRYKWYPVANVNGGDEIFFSVSCKIEHISSGKIQLGIYEFSDPQCRKALRFRSVEVKAAPDWQTISGKVELHPKAQSARFYFLCRDLGNGDTFQVRSLEFRNNSK